MRALIDSHRKENRQNAGNAEAAGKTSAQLQDCRSDLERMQGELYDSQEPFWIRHKGKKQLKVPSALANETVLEHLSYEGAREALEREDDGALGEDKMKMIYKWNENFPETLYANSGGKYVATDENPKEKTKGFVKVIMHFRPKK